MDPLSPLTPLISLPAAAIDTETTGLDPRHARIIQIAALRMDGARIDDDGDWQKFVNPGLPIPEATTAIHGIRDADVEAAGAFPEIWKDFTAYTGQRVLIGYRTGFDISVLKRECALAGIEWQERHWLCVQVLARLVSSAHLAVDTLESLADWLGVTITNRHTALGDAKAAAEIWTAMIPRLREKGIRTLGEALMASGRLLHDGTQELRREAAGIEADASSLERELPALRIDSYAYRRRLGDVMSAPPVTAPGSMSLGDAARMIIEKRVSSVLVRENGIIGIVTERDVLRRFAADPDGGGEATLGSIMSHPLHSLPGGKHLYSAIGRMNRLGIRHLAVTDADGGIVGVVTPRDLLRARANEAIILGDEIQSVSDGAGLAAARAKLPMLARGLLDDEMDARGICAVISAELCNLTRRAAEIAELRMEEAGRGKPPVPYAVMVLGSGGRGESLLAPDQDNAIVYESGEPGGAEDEWFAALGGHIADLLDEAGVPYCKGGIMARNGEWRKSRQGWQSTIDGWVRKSRPQDLLNVDIFFDGVFVHGTSDLSDGVWRYAYARAHASPSFQNLLTELARQWQSPLKMFGGFRADRNNRTDLKRSGLFPIFTGARVLSIRHQIPARSTSERLQATARKGVMTEDTAEAVLAAHETILKAILGQQLRDMSAGVPLSNLVETGRLGTREKRLLRQAVREIELIVDMVAEARF